jgi:hypothetical protein
LNSKGSPLSVRIVVITFGKIAREWEVEDKEMFYKIVMKALGK